MATITGTFNSLVSGTISGVFNNTAGGVLSGIVGTPGPRGLTGATGPAGPTGPAPIWGNITGTLSAQTDLSTVLAGKYSTSNPAGYIDLTTAGLYFYPLTGNPGGFATQAWVIGQNYLTASSLDSYATQSWVNYQLAGYALQSWVTDQGYITASALSPYLLSSTAASTYAVIAAGQPTSGTVGQVLTKNSGTNYDSSWQTLIPGDRYLTTSSTSNAVSNGAKTFTVSTGLSYTTQQDVTIAHDAAHHMHAVVTSYDSVTGVLVVDVQQHTGTGTFTSWTVNVGGTVPLQSVAWGDITGTLGSQTDLATALNSKLEVTTAASTYYLQTNPAGFITSSALTGYATESWVNSQGFATLTTDEKNAIVDASFKTYSFPATYSYDFTGVGTFTLYDASVYSDGEQIQIDQSDVFNITSYTGSLPYSRTIYVPTIYGGAPSVYYVEDLVSYLAGLGIGFTASWSGPSATITLDTFYAALYSGFHYLEKPVTPLQAGSKFMLEEGLNNYLAAIGVTYSAPDGSAYIYSAGSMSWDKPWETWAYSKAVTDGFISGCAKLSGTNNYGPGTQKLPASAAGYAPLNIPHGTAPVAPDNGDIWTTTSGLFYRINGTTVSPATLAGGTYTGKIITATPSSSSAGLNLPPGAAPSAPVNGDIWTTTGGMTLWINGVTHIIATSRFGITFQSGAKCNTAASTASAAGFCIQQGTAPTTPSYGDMWITAANLLQVYTTATRTIVVRETSNAYSAAAKQTMSHSAVGGAGLNVGPVAADITTPASGDIWHNSTAGVTQILGYSNSMRSAMTACRAFVSFNGTGTVAIRASYNVSSITDNGVGTYTVNFTNAMVDTNYLVSGSANDSTAGSTYLWLATGSATNADIARLVGSVRVQSIYGTASKLDASTIDVIVSR